MNEETMNVTEVTENVAETVTEAIPQPEVMWHAAEDTVAKTADNSDMWKNIGCVGAGVLLCVGAYQLVKFLKKRKEAKKAKYTEVPPRKDEPVADAEASTVESEVTDTENTEGKEGTTDK